MACLIFEVRAVLIGYYSKWVLMTVLPLPCIIGQKTCWKRSALFSHVFKDLNKSMIKEELKSFWDTNTLANLQKYFPIVSDWALEAVETQMVNDPSEWQLVDRTRFFLCVW